MKNVGENLSRKDNPNVQDAIDRRVKEEINKVFQEFKEKQEREELRQREDPFKENRDQLGNQENRIFELNEYGKKDNNEEFDFRPNDNPVDGFNNGNEGNIVEMFENREQNYMVTDKNVFEKQLVEEPPREGVQDFGDHFEEVMENVMDIVNESEEKKDMELEDEIEHRLAEVLKDAVNGVADEQAEQDEVGISKR